LGDPQVLVLDEPANGLDPEGIRWLRATLRTLADEGRTVLVSSHQLNEMEEIADRVVILNRGRLVTYGAIAELTAGTDRVLVRTPQLERLRAAVPAPAVVEQTGTDSLIAHGATAAQVGHWAFVAGVELHELRDVRVDLEEMFFALTEEGRP
jgi:ABC-2 type transport system ATP-binding protein